MSQRRLDRLQTLLEEKRFEELRRELKSYDPGRLARMMRGLDGSDIRNVLLRCPEDIKNQVLVQLDDSLLRDLVASEPVADVISLFEVLTPFQQGDLLKRLPDGERDLFLREWPDHLYENLQEPFAYPPESIGRVMDPEPATVRPGWTVEEALKSTDKDVHPPDTSGWLFVVDEDGNFLDDLRYRTLLASSPGESIRELMNFQAITLSPDMDQEEGVRVFESAGAGDLAVVNDRGKLLGAVSRNAILDVAESEDTEDFHRQGASEPLDMDYFSASIGRLARKRIGWLFLLFVAGGLSSTVIGLYEDQLEEAVLLAFFIPLLIGTGGNAGSQTVTSVIRAISLGEVRPSHAGYLLLREGSIGLGLGLVLGGIGFLFATGFWGSSWQMGVILGSSMLGICVLATIIASLIPILVRMLNLDPAAVSAPVITTLIDVLGLLLYFAIAGSVFASMGGV